MTAAGKPTARTIDGGSAVPAKLASCTNQWLRGVLDASGKPGSYTVEDSTDLVGG